MLSFHVVPTAAPTNLAYNSTTTSLNFTWDDIPCGSRGGPYTYKYTFHTSPSVDTSNAFVAFSDLTPCSDYGFHVLGFNGAGDGPKTNLTAATNNQGMSYSFNRTHVRISCL